jgi:hypothetical protein
MEAPIVCGLPGTAKGVSGPIIGAVLFICTFLLYLGSRSILNSMASWECKS